MPEYVIKRNWNRMVRGLLGARIVGRPRWSRR
jgi:hypothetical protein